MENKIEIASSSIDLLKVWKDYFIRKYKNDIIISSILAFGAIIIGLFTEYVLVGGIIFICSLLYLLFVYYFYYLSAVGYINKHKRFYDNLKIVLSEENVQYYTELTESKTKWDAFQRLEKGSYYFLLFDVFGKYLLIPKSVITMKDNDWFEEKLRIIEINQRN